MLDFIRDLYASFKQTSLERVKSPVLGAFVFCWLGFNWEILAILFFSKKPIESRIIYICQNYDILFNLMGAISITTLICYFLPRINKFVTKIQDDPNSETVMLTLTSKIKIAEQQQKIAELEARKKLAEKKEDKFIDNNIYQIKEENSKLEKEIEVLKEHISSLNTSLNQSYVTENHYKEISDKAEATTNGLRAQISELVNAERKLKEELIKKENDISNMAVNLTNCSEQIVQLTNEIDRKNEENANMKANINLQDEKVKLLVKTYPRYFSLLPTSGIPSLEITHNLIKDYMNEKEHMNDNQNSSI